MRSLKRGKSTSALVENITATGIWLFAGGKEYFLPYADFPYFKDQTLKDILDVRLLHGRHLHWPKLDVDLELDNLEHPEKYPLRSKLTRPASSRRASA